MSTETESKFRLDDCPALEPRLAAMGKLRTPWHFEANTVYDRDGELLGARKLLRLRQAGDEALLTFKEPLAEPSPAGVKALREVECAVASFTQMDLVLRGLGYVARLRYEKFRAVWDLDAARVFLDILPFGHFLEIEGTPQAIATTAQALTLDPGLALGANYHDLHQAWRADNALPPMDDILFTEPEKTRLAGLLGRAAIQGESC